MSKKKFVNVDYEGVATEVDITSSIRLGELQVAVKAMYGDALPVGAALIKFYDQQDQQITDLDNITDAYFQKISRSPNGLSSTLSIANTLWKMVSALSSRHHRRL